MSNMKRTSWALVAALTSLGALGLAGCEDPAKDKAKAEVTAPVQAPRDVAAGKQLVFGSEDSKIQFVGAKVTGHHDGSFGKFTGTVNLVDADPTKSRVAVDIDAASISADVPKLTGHLKSADFFDVEKFPKARFESTSIRVGGEKGATHTVTGNLEMHGITKSISFPARIQVNGDQLSVDAEFSIQRKDFGLNYPGKVDDLIRDDVLIKLAIRATGKNS